MSTRLIESFLFADWDELIPQKGEILTDKEKYQSLSVWARKARGCNPKAFDALTEWILDDDQWTVAKIAENEQILMQGVIAKFREQNAKLRNLCQELKASGVVNIAVFKALDNFDSDLKVPIGYPHDEYLSSTVARMFADFSAMQERVVREKIAGQKTGAAGTASIDIYGYVNHLKNCDAQIQWCLFMPDLVEMQQDGFSVENFAYKQNSTLRFVGREILPGSKGTILQETTSILNAMHEFHSGFDYDIILQHHYGKGVDVEEGHRFCGRFMQADAPVPAGFVFWDFLATPSDTPYLTFCSQFAFATYTGDIDAMHNDEGTDGGRMYDVTRNIILGQGVIIPYPEIYWTAEVFLKGFDLESTAYLFSVIIEE